MMCTLFISARPTQLAEVPRPLLQRARLGASFSSLNCTAGQRRAVGHESCHHGDAVGRPPYHTSYPLAARARAHSHGLQRPVPAQHPADDSRLDSRYDWAGRMRPCPGADVCSRRGNPIGSRMGFFQALSMPSTLSLLHGQDPVDRKLQSLSQAETRSGRAVGACRMCSGNSVQPTCTLRKRGKKNKVIQAVRKNRIHSFCVSMLRRSVSSA